MKRMDGRRAEGSQGDQSSGRMESNVHRSSHRRTHRRDYA